MLFGGIVRQVLKMKIWGVPLAGGLLLWLIAALAGPRNLSKNLHQNISNEWMNDAVFICGSLLRYSYGDALIRIVPARHADNCVDGGCAVPEMLSVFNISSGNIAIYSPPRLQ